MRTYFTSLLTLLFLSLNAQTGYDLPEFALDKEEIAANMHFMASDFLEGRRTGSKGIDIAAHFLAEHLEAYGFQPVPGKDNYFQDVPFDLTKPPSSGQLTIGKQNFSHGDNFLIMSGEGLTTKADVVFANYGWVSEDGSQDDYKDLDVKGKIVVVLPGEPGVDDPVSTFQAMGKKRQMAADRGAVALVELFKLSFPWRFFKSYFGKESLRLSDPEVTNTNNSIVYGWLNDDNDAALKLLKSGKKVKGAINNSGVDRQSVRSYNVIGVLEGSDPELKDEYVLMTAHYDHVGVGEQGGGAFTEDDKIFNGARDNAFGSVSLLAAAKALAQKRPKRSVIALFVTGEEIGLLGSQYYANNPLIPLDQVIFNLNTDGAGYNTTEAISIIGWDRTGINDLIEAGVKPFNLDIIKDPSPEQGLFDRSDNVSFAQKGVPCMSFSPGITAFDEELMKNYHQVTDEAETLDFYYVKRFAQAFSHTARLIADADKKPVWKAGDKYEEKGKELYNR